MAKPVYFLLGAIPVVVALLIAVPLITKNEIPMSAANSNDKIEIEYTKHQLKKISNGITERIGAQKTEILLIKNDGDIKYTITEKGYPQPDIKSKIDQKKLDKIKALIKETGLHLNLILFEFLKSKEKNLQLKLIIMDVLIKFIGQN